MKTLLCNDCKKESGIFVPVDIPKNCICCNCKRAFPLPSSYEIQHTKEIHIYKNPQIGFFDYASGFLNKPIEKIYELVMKIPYAEEAIKKSIGGLINLLNDGAHWTVRQDSILRVYQDQNLQISSLEEVQFLDLKDVDKAIGFLAAKYKTIAFTEGGLAGLPANAGPQVAVPAIAADTLFIIGLNLRAIGEYATYCGFDINLQHERLFALNILAFASAPTDAAKQAAMAQLIKIATEIAKRAPWKTLNEKLFVRIIQRIAEALGQRITKAKLAQIVPVISSGIGAGFNAYFTAKVTEAAYYLYRERFLAMKYGSEVIEKTVSPAEDIE